MKPTVLIVEDETVLAGAIRDYLAADGFEPDVAGSAEEAMKLLRASHPELVVLDYRLPRANGLEALQEIKTLAPDAEVVMLTAHGTVRTAVEAMRRGAFDYLAKPVDLDELALVLRRAWEHLRLRRELARLQGTTGGDRRRPQLIGESTASRELAIQIDRLAALDTPGSAPAILITGETGTGKGLVARVIHETSARRAGPFVELNCAAIPAPLLESELFGHERGAFTDARTAKAGLFECADGGTLFLDEIGAIPGEIQPKLLKVIEDKAVRRLGGLRAKAVDVWIIAATNTDLHEAVAAGRFRADLRYRLEVLTLAIPPLRDRSADILPIARHHLAEIARRYGRRAKRLRPDAEARLLGYGWPGNVRELENVIERAALLRSGEDITADDLGLRPPARAALELARDRMRVDFTDGPIELSRVERTLIVEALRTARGNRRRAAELLDVSLETLRYRIEKHGLTSTGEANGS